MFKTRANRRAESSSIRRLTLKRAELLLLSTFLCPRPDQPNYYLTSEAWKKILGKEDSEAINELRAGGLIRLASNVESLEAIATPKLLAEAAAHFKMREDAPAIDVISRLARAATPTDMRRFCPMPLEIVSELGSKIATDFMRREDIFNFDKAYRSPPEGMIKGIKTFGSFLLTAAAAGIIGNRSDALFVHGVEAVGSAPASSTSLDVQTNLSNDADVGKVALSKVALRQEEGDMQQPSTRPGGTRTSEAPSKSSTAPHHDMTSRAALPVTAALPMTSGLPGKAGADSHNVGTGADTGESVLERFFDWVAASWR